MSTLISSAASATTTSNNFISSNSLATSASDASKRFSLVKWLENSQFDVNNEFLGRLTSVPHSNIIDIDSDDLKAGMEISVFRNGEIWRAQIIIPRTASNTIDLPSSTHKISKIRTKALAMGKANDSGDDTIVMLTNTNLGGNGNGGQLNCLDANNNKTFADLNDFEDVTALFGSANVSNNGASPLQQSQTSAGGPMATSSGGANGALTPTGLTPGKLNTAIVTPGSANNKEWQFLQTAINEAGLSDLYQTYSNDITSPNGASNSSNLKPHMYTSNSPSLNSTNLSGHHYRVTVNDMNIETILQMQCELLDQQKELKLIETDTLEQLRLLHTNISRLAKKFDSFEAIVASKKESSSHSSPSKSVQQQPYSLSGANLVKIKDECFQPDPQNNNGLNSSISNSFSPTSSRPRSSRTTRSRSKQQTVYSSTSSLAESIAATVASVFNDNSIT